MNKEFSCYCGLYCENCAIKVKVNPAAITLLNEVKKSGFEKVVQQIPKGNEFWSFLNMMAHEWVCTSCREGSGNPQCKVRTCAQEKVVEMCALCEQYPCNLIENFDEGYPVLKQDNALLREQGWEAWGKLQDERRKRGFVYSE